MGFVSKYFGELTATEVYEILRARSAVFVAEQQCAYQDIDGIDYESLHFFCEEEGKISAYLRAFRRSSDTIQMGRVLTIRRGTGLGGELLREGIKEIRSKMDPKRIVLEAQTYATGYYAREGFRICSDEFLEDGIPHVQMVLELESAE